MCLANPLWAALVVILMIFLHVKSPSVLGLSLHKSDGHFWVDSRDAIASKKAISFRISTMTLSFD